MKRLRSTVALLALLHLLGPAEAAEYADDTCPDRGGTALIVDTPARALTVANGYSLPSCDLVIRTTLDATVVTGLTLRITARSVSIEGPLAIHNSLVDSRVIIIAQDGDIVVSGARLVALKELWLECRGPATCAITIQKGSELRAGRTIRTIARGSVKVDESRLSSSELAVETRE